MKSTKFPKLPICTYPRGIVSKNLQVSIRKLVQPIHKIGLPSQVRPDLIRYEDKFDWMIEETPQPSYISDHVVMPKNLEDVAFQQEEWLSLESDSHLEFVISQNLDLQLSRKIWWDLKAEENYVCSLSVLETDLSSDYPIENFDITTYIDDELYFEAYNQEVTAFFESFTRKTPSVPPRIAGWTLNSGGSGRYNGGYSGSNWGNNGGGSDGGSGGGNSDSGSGSNWGNGGFNYFGLILFFSGCIILGRVLYVYGLKNLKKTTKKAIPHYLKQSKTNKKLLALLPVYGSVLAILAYLFTPENLRQMIESLTEIFVLIAQELGRVLLQLIPPQLHELAQHIGYFIL